MDGCDQDADGFVECPTDCAACYVNSDGDVKCSLCNDRFGLSSTSDSCVSKYMQCKIMISSTSYIGT